MRPEATSTKASRIARSLHDDPVARFVVAVGLVILFQRQLRLDQPVLQLGDRAQVAARASG